MKVGILETGRPPEQLWGEFGTYDSLSRDWLAPLGAEFETYPVLEGVLPDSPLACDLWLITGSKCGVYEPHPWIAPLGAFIRASRDAGRKMVGLCFGHQMIAQALGGEVVKSDKGWGLGVHSYEQVNWPFTPNPGQVRLQTYHQDQVIRAPEGAKVIARSDFCPNAVLHYPGFALSFQGHPEFSVPFATALLKCREGSVLTSAQVSDAIASMSVPDNRAEMARLIADHLDVI